MSDDTRPMPGKRLAEIISNHNDKYHHPTLAPMLAQKERGDLIAEVQRLLKVEKAYDKLREDVDMERCNNMLHAVELDEEINGADAVDYLGGLVERLNAMLAEAPERARRYDE